jgi:hypothetical protein
VTADDDVRVRVIRVGAVVIAHHFEVPNLAYAHAECARFEALVEELGRPAALLMMPDRVLPPATREVIEVYRESAERTPIAAWAAVVGGVMGFAGSIATSIAVRVFARQAVPMRVFRQLPSAVEWLAECSDLEATPDEVLAAAEVLRSGSPTTMRDVGS